MITNIHRAINHHDWHCISASTCCEIKLPLNLLQRQLFDQHDRAYKILLCAPGWLQHGTPSSKAKTLSITPIWTTGLEPLAEVEGALLVVEVLHAPHPKGLGGLLVVGGEHCLHKKHT